MKIKVEPFLMKQGNRVGKAAIEFTDGALKGLHLVGFTICDDPQKGMFVLMPAAVTGKKDGERDRPYFFLRPTDPDAIGRLENEILDAYESMLGDSYTNRPRFKGEVNHHSV